MIKKEITTRNGVVGYLLLDDVDADIAGRAINLCGTAPWRYPCFKLGGDRIKVHREVARRMGILPVWAKGYNPGQIVDHINGDRFDARRSNIRVGSFSHNSMNKRKPQAGSKSGLKGVSKEQNAWVVYVICDGVRHRFGRFKDKYEAARCYDKNALRLFGENACTNAMLGLYPDQQEGA